MKLRRLALTAAFTLGVGLAVAPAATAAPAHPAAAHTRAASSTEKYYRTFVVVNAPTLMGCHIDALLYPIGGEYDGGTIVATQCILSTLEGYDLYLTVEYNGPDPLVQINNNCTWDYEAPTFAACEGIWESGSSNYSYVYTQKSGNHSLTNLTWVPYPSDPAWGWLKDPNGQALAYDSQCGCTVMYTPENVWWELYQQVTAPAYAGWWDVPIALDSNNNGTDGWCMHFSADATRIVYQTNTTTCYVTIPAYEAWAAPYN